MWKRLLKFCDIVKVVYGLKGENIQVASDRNACKAKGYIFIWIATWY